MTPELFPVFCRRCLIVVLGLWTLAACGGGGSSSRQPPPPPPPPNTVDVIVELSALQVIGGGGSGSATADLTINFDDGSITGTVDLAGVDATGVSLGEGFAGEVSRSISDLDEDSSTQWSLPANVTLSASQLDLANAGGLHVKVFTADEPDGALRGQILLGNLRVFMTELNGKKSVPRVDTRASGVAGVTFDPDSGDVVIHVQTKDLDNAAAGHLHRGFAGRNGGVVVELEQDSANPEHWSSVANSQLDATAATNLDEGSLYINMHTPAYPAGEIRGQVVPDDLAVYAVNLSGTQEAPGVDTTAYASGGLTLNTDTSELVVHVTGAGLDDASAAHIHEAFAGANGGVLIELEQDPDDAAHWIAPAGATLDEAQLESLRAGSLYFNVHTPAYPAGEVRGQIAPDGVEIIHVSLSGMQEVPPVATAAKATGGVTLDSETAAIELHITGAELDDAAAAHVHQAFAGANGGVLIELEQDPNDVAHWAAPVDTALDESQLDLLRSGSLYLNVHTPANPPGEVRRADCAGKHRRSHLRHDRRSKRSSSGHRQQCLCGGDVGRGQRRHRRAHQRHGPR